MKKILIILSLSTFFPLSSFARDHRDFPMRESVKQEDMKSCCEQKENCCKDGMACEKQCCTEITCEMKQENQTSQSALEEKQLAKEKVSVDRPERYFGRLDL